MAVYTGEDGKELGKEVEVNYTTDHIGTRMQLDHNKQ